MSVFDGLKFRRVYSPIHNLDPRIKFVYVCAIFAVAIVYWKLLPLAILFLIQVPFVILARVEREWIRSMRGAALLATIIFLTNFIFSFINAGYIVTASNLEYAIAMTLRFIVLIESFSVFFLTTSPDHLGLALEQTRVPFEFCFAFTTAVRFVPVLAEEAQTIMDAQKARGLELERGNFLKRIRNYIPILIPLIVSAIRRSLELAETMESRAWGATKNRTNLYTLKLHKGDLVLIAVTGLVLLTAIYVRVFLTIPSLNDLLGGFFYTARFLI
ncbi:energy-coupling factor transporter transmembrane protein EcfT [Candidatus Bathyarchaeota archaeon]|nr:energy-coupling factor transporter transmembrane protein EcfT [Candidatus Bathyarchaeota archaeon]MCK4434101.1 energy-coupling factor transporter transmembrane protein EcfT [Candidatus Bathyarchaeota archaeon]MCK4668539.1 energy-coupling factor transporter transmembrane protein EcfT [Candidatus Bathyarchaeota archaeon]TET62550.1 MAG: energy-coupling factor transporter transmembrane protein EcfT [Candidatus Bathyarchaeota archaeon]